MKITRINRGGRPKSDKPIFDLGTPELIKHRAMSCPQDHTLSTCPIDSMLGRGQLSVAEHGALTHFRAVHKMMFGRPSIQAMNWLAASVGNPEEMDWPDAERSYRNACAALRADGEGVFKTIERVVIHDYWPRWLPHGHHQSKDWEAVLFKRGVKILSEWSEGT